MNILAIDPGTTESAYVEFNGVRPIAWGKIPHDQMRLLLDVFNRTWGTTYCEMVASYGMPVGAEVFQTVRWIGRYEERCPTPFTLVYRKEVKLHLCGQVRAKDSNIRQALIDRFGPPGTKKAPGLTYGLKKDTWQAFALAVYAWDTFHASAEQRAV